MKLNTFHLAVAASLVSASAAMAAPLSQADFDAALASVSKLEEAGVGECVRNSGTEVAYETEQVDLNKDGYNEVIVTSSPKVLGNGVTGCYGMLGQNQYLAISDGKGGWNVNLGFESTQFKYHERGDGKFPDIELLGRGFCFPIWRYYHGSYGIWKTCSDDNKLVYADTAKWVNSGVPRDAGVETQDVVAAEPDAAVASKVTYSRETDLRGPQFDHNGSLVVVDPKRGLIIYKEPKKSIAGTVKPGDVLFRGKPWDLYEAGTSVHGTAYVFRKGCDPQPYEVSGGQGQSWHTLILKGKAPVRDKKGCGIKSWTQTGGNAELVFENVDD